MAGSRILEYIIAAKDATAGAVSSALSRVKDFAKSVGANLTNIKSGIEMFANVARRAWTVVQKAFAFETMTHQFKTLIGNMAEAEAHMRMLQDLGNTPPFSLEEFAKASRALMVMTDGVLGMKESLVMIGDAAAATGNNIDQLAHEIGRCFAVIRDGQPVTRATMALRNMGVMTPEVAAKLDEMQKAGASVAEMWGYVEESLRKYNGAMKETEETGTGLMGAISSEWDNCVREFGMAFVGAAKNGMGGFLKTMRDFRKDGTLAEWGMDVRDVLMDVVEAFKAAAEAIGGFWKYSGLSDVWHNFKGQFSGTGAFIGTFGSQLSGGSGFGDALKKASIEANKAIADEMTKGFYTGMAARTGWLGSFMKEAIDLSDKDERDKIDERAEMRRRRAEQFAKEEAELEKKEQEKKIVALETAQRKLDEKRAKEAADEEAKAAQKELEKQQKEYEKYLEACEKYEERVRIETERAIAKERDRLWRETVKDFEREYKEAMQEQADAQNRLAKAQQAEAQAWGWYRDRDSWKAQLEEERANAEAEKKFEKEWASLQRRTGWRTANLSDEQEIVRRVGLAREERVAAEQYARQTAEATERAAEALEAIQEAFEEGSAE